MNPTAAPSNAPRNRRGACMHYTRFEERRRTVAETEAEAALSKQLKDAADSRPPSSPRQPQ